MGAKGFSIANIPSIENKANNSFLNQTNIVGREDEIQTELLVYTLSGNSPATDTEITSSDMILTSISINGVASYYSGTLSGYIDIYINDELIEKIQFNCNSSIDVCRKIINIKNSFIPANSVLKANFIRQGGAGGSVLGDISFIGYYA